MRDVDGSSDLDVIAISAQHHHVSNHQVHNHINPILFLHLWKQDPHVRMIEKDIRQGDIPNLDILISPLAKELDLPNLVHDLLRKDLVAIRGLDRDLAVVVRHDVYF